MEEVSTIGLDLAKHVFQAHGASASGAVVFRKKLRREQVLTFFAGQPRCLVAMEACASAHHWARAIGELGHEVRLIPPAYVKPFVKRQKNDMADAEAICEAAQRPTMRFVAVKSEAKQAAAVIFRARDLLVGQRTQIINALRGHLAEYGLIAPQGPSHVERLIAQVEDPASGIPDAARSCLVRLVEMLRRLQDRDRRTRPRDRRPSQGGRRGPPSHDGAGDRAIDRHRHRGARAARRDLPIGSGLRRLGRPHAGAEVDRRQGAARANLPHGRANAPAPSHHRGQRRGSLGQAQGRAARLLARHACSPASRRCWSSWRWRTRTPASPGRCSPRAGSIELRP